MRAYSISIIVLMLVVLVSACSPGPIATEMGAQPTSIPAPTLDLGPVKLLWSAAADPNLFNTPSGLAFDGQENLYVVDTLNHQIKVFNPEGKSVAIWGGAGSGEGQFNFAWKQDLTMDEADEVWAGVTLDAAGNLYVADVGNMRIQKLDSQGKFLAQWRTTDLEAGKPSQAYDVAVDSQGNIYTVDLESFVTKYDPEGHLLKRWGGPGLGDEQFMESGPLTIDALDNLYVCDTKRESIIKFDTDGNLLARFKVEAKAGGAALFSTPTGIAIDAQGNIYTTDFLTNRIVVLDRNGQFLMEWGRQGKDAGLLYGPADVAVDAEGNIYVSEIYNHRIQKFEPVK